MIPEDTESDTNPSLLRQLSEQQQVRLTEILDEYLQQLEERAAPSQAELVAQYPELGHALKLYLEKLADLHRMTDGDRPIGSDLSGKVLGDYRLLYEIGRGGMGIVFSAQQQSLDRQVAVKLLPMAAMLDEKFIERFRNEARAAAYLEHPNIVPVYTVGEEGGIHYFAMRLIDGQSLDQRIAIHNTNQTRPPTNSALKQFADVAEALHSAHEFGIVHRDIKPSNLLLDNSGKLWVADFGLARFQDERAITGTGEMIGTMRYMSPEQAHGRSELVDHRTDIYSLGATLYELLTGQPAIPGEEGPNLLATITNSSPTRLRKLRPDLSRDLQTVLEKAMLRHRDDRYQVAQEFADDLRRVALGQPIATKLVSPIVLVSRWTIAHTRLVTVAATVLLIAGLTLTMAAYLVNAEIMRERDQADESARKSRALVLELQRTLDELALVPGVEQVRQDLTRSTLKYYQEFAEESQGEPRMQDQLANAYAQMGKLSEDLGRTSEAVAYFEQAEKLFEQLSEEDTNSELFLPHRRENLNHLAVVMDQAGRGNEALELLSNSLVALREDYTQSRLTDAHAVEYGLTENNYGLLLKKQGQPEQAKSAFRRAIDVFTAEQTMRPSDQKAARGLGAALHNLGMCYAVHPAPTNPDNREQANTTDQQMALDLFDRALTIQLNIAQNAENGLRASIDLVTTYLNVGSLHLARENPSKAASAFSRAVMIGKRLVDIAPQVDTYRRDLAVCLSNLGMAQFQQGDYLLAKQSLKDAVHHYRSLLATFPEHTGLQSSLGIALNNQGMVFQQLGESKQAEEAYSRAASLLEATKKNAPTAADTRALDKLYFNYAKMLQDAGRQAEAKQILQRQLALFSSEKDES